jgi:hypothetical protein
MPYEREGNPIPIGQQQSTSNVYQPPVRSEEYVVDHKANQRRRQTAAQNIEKSGQQGINATSGNSEESKSTSEETVTLSPAAAALARKEQAFRRQQQELKEQMTSLEKERAEIAELKAIKAKLAAKDYSDIEKFVPYDEYTNYLIEKDSGSTPEQQELQRLNTELETVKKAQSDEVSKRLEAAVEERRKAVTALVDADVNYSTIKELNMQEAVVQHIRDTWDQDSVELTPEQAAKEVEEILNEKAAKWASLSKFKSKQSVDEKKELPPLKPGVKTLTNNMAATGEIKRPARSYEGMNDSQRYAEAKRRAQEKLK